MVLLMVAGFGKGIGTLRLLGYIGWIWNLAFWQCNIVQVVI